MMAIWVRVSLVGYHRGPRGEERFHELLRVADDPGIPGTPGEMSDRSARVVLFALDRADVEDPWSYPPNFPQDTSTADYRVRLGFERVAAWLAGRPASALDEWRAGQGDASLLVEAGIVAGALSLRVPPALLSQCARLGLPLEIRTTRCELPELADDLLAFLPDASPFTPQHLVALYAADRVPEDDGFTVELLTAPGAQTPTGFRMAAGEGWRVTAWLEEGPGTGECVRQLPAANPPPVPVEAIARCSRLLRCTTTQDPFGEHGYDFAGFLTALMRTYGAAVYRQSTRRWIHAAG